MAQRPRRRRRFLIAAIGVGVLAGLAAAEVLLRVYQPYNAFGAGYEMEWFRTDSRIRTTFTVDDDMGFRPILGNGFYNRFGTLENKYDPEKKPGTTRLLFVGDSVTERAAIIDGLKALYGESRFEYWNAGVESFNTVQEVSFYKKFNAAIHPDHVILTFHMNDFETTPVAFYNHDGDLVVYTLDAPLTRINRFLFTYSRLYRIYLGTVTRRYGSRKELYEETLRSLSELDQLLRASQVRFTVLVLPILKPDDAWDPAEIFARKTILEFVQRSHMEYVDLLEPLHGAFREGVNPWETPGDTWHPSKALGLYFARYLYDRGLLQEAVSR